MPKLIHSRDGTYIAEFELKPGIYNIGRRPDCQIRLDDATVSGSHAKITVKNSGYLKGTFDIRVEDEGSTNGTLINGQKVRHYLMKHGDVARIGLHDLTLVDENTRSFETTEVILPDS